MATADLRRGDALLIVDPQYDFCPGGALGVASGDEIVPVLNRWIAAAERAGVPIYVSRDWHPPGHVGFVERGGPWPPHCVQGSAGAAFHAALRLPPDVPIIIKGDALDVDSYSDFEGTGLARQLHAAGVRRLWVGGLATDYCVRATVLDGLREGFDVRPEDGGAALTEMEAAGAALEDGNGV